MPRATGYYKTTRPICSQFFEPGPYVLTVEGYPGTYCVETIAEGDGGPIDSLPPDTSGTISLIGVNFDKVVPEASAPALLQDIESGPDLIAVDTKVKYSGTKACDAAGNLGDAIYSPQSSERTINFICTDLKPASR
jgi:hypothetical protein